MYCSVLGCVLLYVVYKLLPSPLSGDGVPHELLTVSVSIWYKSVPTACVPGVSMPMWMWHRHGRTYIQNVYIKLNCLCEHLCAYVVKLFCVCVCVYIRLHVSACLYVQYYSLRTPLTVPPAIPHFKEVIVVALTCDIVVTAPRSSQGQDSVKRRYGSGSTSLTPVTSQSTYGRWGESYLSNQTTHLWDLSNQTTHL